MIEEKAGDQFFIVSYIQLTTPQKNSPKKSAFAIATKIFSYPNKIVSVRVLIGKVFILEKKAGPEDEPLLPTDVKADGVKADGAKPDVVL